MHELILIVTYTTYILVWGYMHELIAIVTYTTFKCFIVIDDRLMIPQVKYCDCGMLLYMNIPLSEK
jgi:hypothetical protein